MSKFIYFTKNFNKHKDLCVKYNTKSEKLVLPNENTILKFNKINEMIKTPFKIYYDMETYGKYLKNSKQNSKFKILHMSSFLNHI